MSSVTPFSLASLAMTPMSILLPPKPTEPASLATILNVVDAAQYTFKDFSARILSGRITDGGAKLQRLSRYKEKGNANHQFISIEVDVGNGEIYWLKVERAVPPNTRIFAPEFSSSLAHSADQVSVLHTC